MRKRLRPRPTQCPACGSTYLQASGIAHYTCERCGERFTNHVGEWRRAADVRRAYENLEYERSDVLRLLRCTAVALRKVEGLEGELFEALAPILRDPPVRGGTHPGTRDRVLKRDRRMCQICGATEPDSAIELDHIIPTALGGPDTDWNLWVLCEPCNREKGTRIIHEGLTKVYRLIRKHGGKDA